ncbi:MAG: hypothetical protein HYX53_06960 [Chloroflexi bacterium]|nr:hypothetical protein [Chloroflexota bacterium]
MYPDYDIVITLANDRVASDQLRAATSRMLNEAGFGWRATVARRLRQLAVAIDTPVACPMTTPPPQTQR